MKDGPDIARVAALIGDPARANMLTALMGGRALTASELAQEAGVTAQTASSHLARLAEGGLIRQRRQGRHRYHQLASAEVAALLESLMGLAAGAGHLRGPDGTPPGPAGCWSREAVPCRAGIHRAARAASARAGRPSDDRRGTCRCSDPATYAR